MRLLFLSKIKSFRLRKFASDSNLIAQWTKLVTMGKSGIG